MATLATLATLGRSLKGVTVEPWRSRLLGCSLPRFLAFSLSSVITRTFPHYRVPSTDSPSRIATSRSQSLLLGWAGFDRQTD